MSEKSKKTQANEKQTKNSPLRHEVTYFNQLLIK